MRFWPRLTPAHPNPPATSSADAVEMSVVARQEAINRCCDVVARYSGSELERRALRDAVSQVCAQSRAEGVPAERLLVEVKQALNRLESPTALSYADSQRLRGRVISMLIDTYYTTND